MTSPSPYNATLLERRDIHEALAIFKVRYDAGEHPGFEPGQFTTLGLVDPANPDAPPPAAGSRRRGPKMIRRAYSIASPATTKDHLAFYAVHVNDGKLTTMLWQLKPGDPLFMDTKIKGEFTLNNIPDGKDLVMVGTGTGLGPFISMLNTYRAAGRWRKLILIEGCRFARDLGYFDQLTRIAAEDESIVYLPTVTREPDDTPWLGLRGRVQNILDPENFNKLAGTPLDPAQCHVLLCGNPAMIDQTSADLTDQGFVTRDRHHPDGNLHFERYW